jgi:toxin CptA
LAAPTARWCSSAFEFARFFLRKHGHALTALSLHNAPPVVYPLGRSYLLGGLLLALWLAGVLLVLAWQGLTQSSLWRLGAGLGAVLLAGMAAGIRWKNAPQGQLAWDGEAWRWESASYHSSLAAYELAVAADFQTCLLLRLENPAGASLWLWAEWSTLPARWLDLRRAVYSPRRSSNAAQAHDVLAAQPALSPTLSASAVLTTSVASAVAVSTARPSMEATRPQP